MAKNKRTVEDIAGDLFPALELFGQLFTADGQLQKRFDSVRELIVELMEADPKYQTKLGVAKPFGQEVNSEILRWLIDNYLGGRWYFDTPLVEVVDRLFAQSSIRGNPLNRDKGR